MVGGQRVRGRIETTEWNDLSEERRVDRRDGEKLVPHAAGEPLRWILWPRAASTTGKREASQHDERGRSNT